jgi:hypothetical protein
LYVDAKGSVDSVSSLGVENGYLGLCGNHSPQKSQKSVNVYYGKQKIKISCQGYGVVATLNE